MNRDRDRDRERERERERNKRYIFSGNTRTEKCEIQISAFTVIVKKDYVNEKKGHQKGIHEKGPFKRFQIQLVHSP